MMGLSIAQMKLSRIARLGAERLQEKCPWVVFTSGRRDLESQARAMAINTAKNREWIGQTYLAAHRLQAWVNANPDAQTPEQISEGLYMTMLGMSDREVMAISRHLTGDAFDVRPMLDGGVPTLYGQKILDAIQELAGVQKVLTKEGGLDVWHVQFAPSVEV
jgi:hypothetical protein